MKPSIVRRAFRRTHATISGRNVAFLCVRVPLDAFGVDVRFPEDERMGEPTDQEGVWEKKLEDGTTAKTVILPGGMVFGTFAKEPWMPEFMDAYLKYLGTLDQITTSPLGLEVQELVDTSPWLVEFSVLLAQSAQNQGVLLVFGASTSKADERRAVQDMASLCNRWLRRGIALNVFRSIGIDPDVEVA